MSNLNKDEHEQLLNTKPVNQVIDKHIHKGKRALIAILQDIQDEYGFLPEKALNIVSERVKIPMAQIYGVATFYSQFRLKPLGKYVISVCDGTACHVRGSTDLINEVRSSLGINPDETTEDGLFSLKVVACIGACSLAPALVINDEETYAKVTPHKLSQIIDEYRKKDN
jgi:NADH-quinone oxidoreductase E subunit